jgi:hypothetical protein
LPRCVHGLSRKRAERRFSAAVSALKELGILSGKRLERSEQGTPGEFDHMTDEELDRELIEMAERMGFVRKEMQH